MPRARCRRRTSTQEDAWLVLAARALAKQLNAISLAVDGETRQGAFYRSLRADELDAAAGGEQQRRRHGAGGGVGLRLAARRRSPPPSAASRSSATTSRSTASRPIRRKAKQNQRFVVVLKMTEPQPQFGRVIVADYLPAGFEIDNPRLVSSGETGTLAWIADAAEPVNSEFRDDRFTAAFDRKRAIRRRCSRSPMWCARCRRATTCCRRPMVEDMYRPDRFGRTATGAIEITAAK